MDGLTLNKAEWTLLWHAACEQRDELEEWLEDGDSDLRATYAADRATWVSIINKLYVIRVTDPAVRD